MEVLAAVTVTGRPRLLQHGMEYAWDTQYVGLPLYERGSTHCNELAPLTDNEEPCDLRGIHECIDTGSA